MELEIYHNLWDTKEWQDSLAQHHLLLSQVKEGEREYQDSLGWLDLDEWANDAILDNIESLAQGIREKADVFVLIGVGGSNNAARSVIEAIAKKDGIEIIYAGNTLSAKAYADLLENLRDKSVYINCIAKNFETLEPGLAFRILRKYLHDRYGEAAKERIIATGTRHSTLHRLCQEQGYRFLDFPLNIGGRYTAFSNVGLLPMAVAGIDIRALLNGARNMRHHLWHTEPMENMAYQYACFRNMAYRKGYKIEVLSSFEPSFAYFDKWWIQLFAESEGKQARGIYPTAHIFSEELHSVGQFLQEGEPIVFETFLEVEDIGYSKTVVNDGKQDYFDYLDGMDIASINKAAMQATIQAHTRCLPCAKIKTAHIDAYAFGELFYFFAFSCYLSCKMMGVNPFNQPGVEAYKEYMFRILKKE